MYHTYDFAVVAADSGEYIITDKQGGSYYLPKQLIPECRLSMGDILHVTAEQPLEMTERAGTNSIICHGKTAVCLQGSLLYQSRTAEFLVFNTAYNSVLLSEPDSGKDYVIFTSYVTEGYRTPGISWSSVTEGNYVKFLLFGSVPVMPAPKLRHSFRIRRKNKKTPAVRSFLNDTYGASSGASMISMPSSSTTAGRVS